MSAGRTSRAAAVANQQLRREREVRGIVDTVLRIAKSIGVAETEVHVDESISALTRFANNAIHQNVAEHTVNVSVRTQVDQRTARATTNRTDEDSLRAAIEASLSLAHSQPKNPHLLPLPGKQRYRGVNRFIKQTAALTPEDRARAVRRARDLAIKNGQTAAGIFSSAQAQNAMGNSRGLFAAYHDNHSVFSFTMQEGSAASLGKEKSAEGYRLGPQRVT